MPAKKKWTKSELRLREKLLALVVEGKISAREAARRLKVSPPTISYHLSR